MSGTHRLVRLAAWVPAALVVLVSLAACASGPRREPWIEDGQVVGYFTRQKVQGGFDCRYYDPRNRLLRIEARDDADALTSGACVTRFAYDDAGRLTSERHADASGAASPCDDGWASVLYSYSGDGAGDLVVERAYQDASGRPTRCGAGFAFARLVFSGPKGPVKEIFLEDESRRPAAATWDGVAGTSHVTVASLQGIGEVRCAVYYGPGGEIIDRKAISGATSFTTQSQSTSYTTYSRSGGRVIATTTTTTSTQSWSSR